MVRTSESRTTAARGCLVPQLDQDRKVQDGGDRRVVERQDGAVGGRGLQFLRQPVELGVIKFAMVEARD
jgi:hypothetical protein